MYGSLCFAVEPVVCFVLGNVVSLSVALGGLVFMNMVVDDTIVKDSDILAECLVDELMELTSHYGVQGWTRDSILAEQSPGKEFGILDTTA